MNDVPSPQGPAAPRPSPFRAEAIRNLERPLAARPPLVKPALRPRWAGIGIVFLAAALIAATWS